ncbi:hypothetical protein CAEBREN_28071 [Caenorhabditis brenneri]|uniref:Uncharacterized protein n=1 Tax=Caenorhabditis brenneri TaxID=135651 RepID=G0P247_CAEBE|nr:hypothetical protein CAEBREN_28071 [Caenorhabditis brenneri]
MSLQKEHKEQPDSPEDVKMWEKLGRSEWERGKNKNIDRCEVKSKYGYDTTLTFSENYVGTLKRYSPSKLLSKNTTQLIIGSDESST